jgi:hypothetical protein
VSKRSGFGGVHGCLAVGVAVAFVVVVDLVGRKIRHPMMVRAES